MPSPGAATEDMRLSPYRLYLLQLTESFVFPAS